MPQPPSSPKPRTNPARAACWVVFAVLVGFAFALGAAAGAYPGGTYFNRSSSGFDWFTNFWCDALQNPALNGAPNGRGAKYAAIALWVLSSGLLPFWGVAAGLVLPHRRGYRGARLQIVLLGVGATLGLMALTLLPSNQHRLAHGIVACIAGPLGITAAALVVFTGWVMGSLPKWMTFLGAAMLAAALANLLQYTREIWFGSASNSWLPSIQKLATLLFVFWVTSLTSLAFSGRTVPVSARERRHLQPSRGGKQR